MCVHRERYVTGLRVLVKDIKAFKYEIKVRGYCVGLAIAWGFPKVCFVCVCVWWGLFLAVKITNMNIFLLLFLLDSEFLYSQSVSTCRHAYEVMGSFLTKPKSI